MKKVFRIWHTLRDKADELVCTTTSKNWANDIFQILRFARCKGGSSFRVEGAGSMPAYNTLEVGINDAKEIIVNHPSLEPDENGVGHIVFSPEQARNFAEILYKKADESEGSK